MRGSRQCFHPSSRSSLSEKRMDDSLSEPHRTTSTIGMSVGSSITPSIASHTSCLFSAVENSGYESDTGPGITVPFPQVLLASTIACSCRPGSSLSTKKFSAGGPDSPPGSPLHLRDCSRQSFAFYVPTAIALALPGAATPPPTENFILLSLLFCLHLHLHRRRICLYDSFLYPNGR